MSKYYEKEEQTSEKKEKKGKKVGVIISKVFGTLGAIALFVIAAGFKGAGGGDA